MCGSNVVTMRSSLVLYLLYRLRNPPQPLKALSLLSILVMCKIPLRGFVSAKRTTLCPSRKPHKRSAAVSNKKTFQDSNGPELFNGHTSSREKGFLCLASEQPTPTLPSVTLSSHLTHGISAQMLLGLVTPEAGLGNLHPEPPPLGQHRANFPPRQRSLQRPVQRAFP